MLTLHAPVAGILCTLPFIHNVLRAHPSCIKMIHKSEAFTREELDGVVDTFLQKEVDPELAGGFESYLWEVVGLKGHWHPSVSGLARMFEEEFGVGKYDLEDFLVFGYDSLMVDEGVRKKSEVKGKRGREESVKEFACALNYECGSMLVDDDIFVY